MKSCFFLGSTYHKRFVPQAHEFNYPYYYFAFDLDELNLIEKRFFFFSYNRFNLFSLRDRDYLWDQSDPIKDKLLLFIKKNVSSFDVNLVKRIVLFTSPRFLFKPFNPVSFYYCYDVHDQVCLYLAEVNNTYHEKHLYYMLASDQSSGTYVVNKSFYVSPFLYEKGYYSFRFSSFDSSEVKHEVSVQYYLEERLHFLATMVGKRYSLKRFVFLKLMFSYPFTLFMTMPRILYQAILLYYKKSIPARSKPMKKHDNTLVYKKETGFQKYYRKLFFSFMSRFKKGRASFYLPDKSLISLGEGEEVKAHFDIKSYQFFKILVKRGEIGLGEAYVEQAYDSLDLTALIKYFIDHIPMIRREYNGKFIYKCLYFLKHVFRRNTVKKSKKNIFSHYDVGNSFYSLFLDSDYFYSSAYFLNEDDSLNMAQYQKCDLMIEKLQVSSDHHVLEIGCGWGSLAIYLARKVGCKVTGITISKAQYEFSVARVKEEGLDHLIDIQFKDYRHVDGVFDRLLSVEMLEAVGYSFLPSFFKKCSSLLKSDGIAVLQSILFPNDGYEAYCSTSDWIREYIFPGGHLPCLEHIQSIVGGQTDFSLFQGESLGQSYAKTLRLWRDCLEESKSQVFALGYDLRFYRTWFYYFSYCEAAFSSGYIDVKQLVFTKPLVSYEEMLMNSKIMKLC